MYDNLKRIVKNNKRLYRFLKYVAEKLYVPYEFYLDFKAILDLKSAENKIKAKHKDEIINVVFMIQFIPSWNKVKTIYEYMKCDNRFNTSIFCIPMEKGHTVFESSTYNSNETYEWFRNNGYTDIVNALTDNNQWFSLEELSPDYVIYTRPYNDLLPKAYKSNTVAKFTLISLVEYGVNLSSMLYITTTKDFFRNVALYFADCQESWNFFYKQNAFNINNKYNKAHMNGIPVLEQQLCLDKKITKIWNYAEGLFKIIWTPRWSTDSKTGGSNFFKYKKTFFDLAECNKKIGILIRPHPLMFTNFYKTGEMSEMEIIEYKKTCCNLGNVKIDETEEYSNTFWQSDVLVTDFSSIIIEYLITEKPIIYCTSNLDIYYLNLMKEILNVCYIANDEKDVLKYISDISNGIDPLREVRINLANQIKNNYALNSGERISNTIFYDAIERSILIKKD